MSSPELDHRDRRSSSQIKGSYRKSYDAYSTTARGDYGRDFSEKCQVRATGFPAEVSDIDIKDVVIHEMEKFGEVLNIQLQGHDHNRQAHVLFRDDDAARELRRYCLERHCKVIAFQRALHFDFDLNDRRGSSYRNSYSQGSSYKPVYRNNDKYDRNDFNDRGYTNSRDRFNDNHINPRATRTLFVGNLDQSITKEELMRIFEHWGAIDDIDVKRPPNGIPAYAFIKYLELEAAASAKNQMFGKEINGRLIKVGYGKTQPSTRLWIGGLGQWCSTDLLNREFDRFGALRKIEYMKGSRHAFVEFESLDAASAAHTEMRGFPLGGPDRKIKIDYAEPDSNCHSSDDYDRTFDSRDGYRNRAEKFQSEQNNGRNYERHRRTSESESRRRTRSRSPIENDRYDYKERMKKNSPALLPVHNNKGNTDSKSSNGHNYTKVEEITVENLTDVSKRFVVAWRGAFALKNSAFPVRMHLIGGNPELANFYLRGMGVGAGPAFKVLSVTQRLRLDQSKLDEVARRVQHVGVSGHCILLALATGDDVELEDCYQRRPLKSLVTYFRKKEAAGVIILSTEGPSGKQEETGMLHAFPPCAFSHQYLLRTAPNLGQTPSKEDHLLVIIVKGNTL